MVLNAMNKNDTDPVPAEKPKRVRFAKFYKLINDIRVRVLKKRASRKHSVQGSVVLHEEAQEIFENIMQFSELEAVDVMVAKSDIVAASHTTSLESLKKLFVAESHSRIPIYNSSIDEVVGFIHVKDLLSATLRREKCTISDLMRPIIFVPFTLKLPELLKKMKQSKTHIAIVLDEYGETDGLVTIENVVEQIVGDIQDEHDTDACQLAKLDDGSYVVDACIKISALEKLLGWRFNVDTTKKDFDTLGGLLIAHFHYIPRPQEKFTFQDRCVLEVLDASNRKIKKVKLTLLV